MEKFIETIGKRFEIGYYPKEYNPRIHGAYNPGRYYGKADTKFTQLKLAEIPAWLSRRNYDPVSAVKCVSRGWARWNHKWMNPPRAGLAPWIQITMCISLFYAINAYPKLKSGGHRHCKYHW